MLFLNESSNSGEVGLKWGVEASKEWDRSSDSPPSGSRIATTRVKFG